MSRRDRPDLSDRLAMTSDHDSLAALDLAQDLAELGFGLVGRVRFGHQRSMRGLVRLVKHAAAADAEFCPCSWLVDSTAAAGAGWPVVVSSAPGVAVAIERAGANPAGGRPVRADTSV